MAAELSLFSNALISTTHLSHWILKLHIFIKGLRKKQQLMYTVAALITSPEVTGCCFPVETAGGDDTTLGRSQSSYSLLCGAPRLGRHSWYSTARLHNLTT